MFQGFLSFLSLGVDKVSAPLRRGSGERALLGLWQ